ncbi:MAG: septum formation initiator family protein [Candidatus Carbobacillus sp.]|nr:septum formation initiator family protein [Candidatus Carbobacillus sp.]
MGKARRRKKIAQFMFLLLFGFGLSLGYREWQMLKAQEAQKAAVVARLSELQEENEQLLRERARLNDTHYIAALARTLFYWGKEGDVIFQIVPMDPSQGR